MRTSISKRNILKPSVLFLSMSMFILSALLFISCSESDTSETLASDESLIEQIESATTVEVDESSLPAAATNVFNGELSDSFVESVQLASGLGYKVSIYSDNEEWANATSDVFFTLQGRFLKDLREKALKRRHRCFNFNFPITFFMPDNTTITLNERTDWMLIREWYQEHPNANARPKIVFPVDITLEDGTVETLLDRSELVDLKEACKEGRNKRKCFRLVLPIRFTMPDATEITVVERVDFKLIRDWYIANPDIQERGRINYPVDIIYRNTTTATINNFAEMIAAKQACK